MKFIRKISIFMIILICMNLFLSVSASVYTPPFETYSEALMVVSTDSGNIIYSDNENGQIDPGVMVQLMTGYIAILYYTDLEGTYITTTSEAIILSDTSGLYYADIQVGESFSVYDLLCALFIQNSYEAANTLALAIGGSDAGFAEIMNETAAEMGLTSTSFANAYGFEDSDQYSTASDLYKMVSIMLENETFETFCTMTSYTLPDYSDRQRILSSNLLMQNQASSTYYYSGVSGVKAGTTDSSGRCAIVNCTIDSESYMVIAMGGAVYQDDGTYYDTNTVFSDIKNCLDWVYNDFRTETIVTEGETVAEVKINMSMSVSTMLLAASEDFSVILPTQTDATAVLQVVDIPDSLDAPIAAGDIVGTITFYLSDTEIGSVNLIATQDVTQNQFLYLMNFIESIFTSIWFIIIAVATLIFTIVYVFIIIRMNKRKRSNKVIRRKRY